jgi:anti-sigma28 factor (negative regulator of flagellin synthesis)
MQISAFGNEPPQPSQSETGTVKSETPSSIGAAQNSHGFSASSDAVQLSKLGSVLNGLENGATLMRRHVQQAMSAVRGGTYRVDPLQLSKRIVGEALGFS